MPTGTLQVRVLNTGWYDSVYAGTGGTGSPGGFGVFPDIDGHSVWCFQYFTSSVKRIDLNTNTATVTWTYPYPYGNPPTFQDGTPFFFQDPAGFVYVLTNPVNNVGCQLKKLDPSAAMAEVGSMSWPNAGSGQVPNSFQVFTVSGSYYLAYFGSFYGIINLSTMSSVMSGTTPGQTTCGTFVDDSNDVWFVSRTNNGSFPNAKVIYHFYKSVAFASPGAEQFNIGGTLADFSLNTSGGFCCYIPGADKCFIGNSVGYTGDMAIVDLVAHTYIKVLDNLTNFYNGTFDAPWSAMRNGWQNNVLAIPGDTNLLERGGIVNFIDPTLSIVDSVDVVSALFSNALDAAQNSPGLTYQGVYSGATTYNFGDVVKGSDNNYYIRMNTGSGTDPVAQANSANANNGTTGYTSWVPFVPPLQRDASGSLSGGTGVSVSSNVLTVNLTGTGNPYPFYVGQKITFYGISTLGGPTFLNGQTVTITAATGTTQFQANFTHADYPLTACNGTWNRKMTPPFSNMVWFNTSQQLVMGYEYVGSPIFLLSWLSGPTLTSCTPSSGSTVGGTAITNLAGTGFQNGATVTFDGIPATSVVWVSSTQLTCVTPTHAAGAVDVVVTNPDTLSATLTNGYTYVAPPTVTNCTPSSGPISGGTAITNLAGTDFQNGATVTFGGTPATGVMWISSTELMCVTPAHTLGLVNIVVTNPDAQFGTLVNGYTYTAVPTSTAVNSSQAPSQYEDEVTFTATVTGTSPTPTGTVNFFDGLTLLATVNVLPVDSSTANAQYVTNALTPGTHQITAVYSGDSIYAGSTSPIFLQQVTAVIIPPNILPSFALVASFTENGDVNLPPAATLYSIPATASAGQSVTLLWNTTSVAAVQITGTNGFDPTFDTGVLTTGGSGAYVVGNGWTHTIMLTMTCYDHNGAVLGVIGQTTVTIA